MGKSLGSYRIEKSSSSDTTNIKWTLKNPTNNEKPKKKNTNKKSSATNIIYIQETETDKPPVNKVFKIENIDTEKVKKEDPGKRFQKSSADNCKIKQGFKRPSR